MPILSQYWFSESFFAGPFEGRNQPYPEGGWAWISESGQEQATLSWNREDSEVILNFATVASNPLVISTIDKLLTGGVTRTSGVMAQGVFWPNVPYYSKDPSRHSASDMLVRVYFDFHIDTPWYCSDADGDISYYLFFSLDRTGALQGSVDGWSYNYSGGGPFCTGSIDDGLNSAVPGGMAPLQNLVNEAIALDANGHYSTLYYLPGSGTRAQGAFDENADTDVALVLLPR